MVNPRFARATWGLVAFLLGVVAWGAYVRATGSGAGCGAHWPVCNGEIVPRAPALETLVEFSHRVSSGLVTLAVIAWAAWGYRAFPRGHRVQAGVVLGTVAILVEGGIGAALVLLRLTGKDESLARAGVMALHLVNTFFLLGVVTLTGAWAGGTGRPRLRDQGAIGVLVPAALVAMVALGVSGAIAALGDTLFPARSLAEGFRQDLAGGAHLLLRLRVLHPLLAVAVALFLLGTAAVASLLRPGRQVRRTAIALAALVVVQLTAGLVNLALLAPVWMQLLHLFLADAVWLALVVLGAAALAEDAPRLAVQGLGEPGSASAR
ncbi:MAG TPA: COX15/CtaA family protein [Myxococcaceae bacterium]|nr:COX15/CtaA family protein [Myxococcaceae bacterium]